MSSPRGIKHRIEQSWMERGGLALALRPLAWLLCALVFIRRTAYRLKIFQTTTLPVPVIVIGNISVGGTGKTPLTIWLANYLAKNGYRPGIVSRGYGGKARKWPQQVRADGDPIMVGDEAIVISRRSNCPMAVGPRRVAAAEALIKHHDIDIILSDDGMQHYALGRTIEIAVIDGVRRFGNGLCLPAGPLREPIKRLKEVDFIVTNGIAAQAEVSMRYEGKMLNHLDDSSEKPLGSLKHETVHAIAGIGNPERFFEQLRRAGLHLIEHVFADHHEFSPKDLDFGDDLPIIMTEKDAVKCRRFLLSNCWYYPVTAILPDEFGLQVLNLLEKRHG
ncbi:MAG: tetraacyldisaccharide 4'-kinase [Gammaproteobacteria bacterium]